MLARTGNYIVLYHDVGSFSPDSGRILVLGKRQAST